MMDLKDRNFDKEIKRLGKILQQESDISLGLINNILKNLSENNLISFFHIMLQDTKKSDGWETSDIEGRMDQLEKADLISDASIKKNILSSSEISAFLVFSALERVAEILQEFTQNFLRAFWGTENNICPSCGNEVNSNSLYCCRCGKKLENESWDAGINEITTKIGKEILKKVANKIYYVKKNESLIYGCFYKNNISRRDELYIKGSLKSMKMDISVLEDRIYFETKRNEDRLDKVVKTINNIANELKFQKINNNI